jgi:predicted TIM-barrel fold metal-dependent hydrolase
MTTMAAEDFRVFDADGHVLEDDDELAGHFEGTYQFGRRMKAFSLFPGLDGWSRGMQIQRDDGGRRYMHTDAKVWGEIIDELKIEGTVVYPTAGLAHGLMYDVPVAVATATAYNNWLEERYCKLDRRIYGAGLIPIQDPVAAAKELARCKQQRVNFPVGMICSRNAMHRTLGDAFFDPIYEAAEKLDMPLALHGGPMLGMGFDNFDEVAKMHSLSHAFPLFIHIVDMIFSGVFDRFPNLRVAYLEAGASWVPWMMDRLDYEYSGMVGVRVRQRIRKRPSDYFKSDNLWFSIELDEHYGLKGTLDCIGSERLFYASDYPHEPKDSEMRHELEEFLENESISRDARQNIVYNNAVRFYGIKSPVRAS